MENIADSVLDQQILSRVVASRFLEEALSQALLVLNLHRFVEMCHEDPIACLAGNTTSHREDASTTCTERFVVPEALRVEVKETHAESKSYDDEY